MMVVIQYAHIPIGYEGGMCMIKKAAGFILAMTMVLSMIGCGQKTEQSGTDPIVSGPDPAIEQSATMTPTPEVTETVEGGIYLIIPTEVGLSAQEEAEIISGAKKEGYKVVVKTYGNDTAKQTEAFDAAISANASVIICDNIDKNATSESAQKARDAGIPTILMNKGVEGSGLAAAQILTDRFVCIPRLAELFAEKTGKISNYAFIYTADNEDMADDVESFAEALASYGSMTNVDRVNADEFNLEAIKETVRQLLAEKPEIDALVCANGIQAHAVTDVVEETEAELTVICLDGDDEVSTRVLGGKIYASIVKPAEDLGATAIKDAAALLKSGTTGTNERMYYAGVILTTNEIVTVVSPTPTEVPEPGTTGAASDSSAAQDVSGDTDLSSVDVEIPESTDTGFDDGTDIIDEDLDEDTDGTLPIEIVDEENYDDGMEGRPDMQ